MNGFVKQLRGEWRRLKLPAANARIVVAVSGGADSVGLLAALHELQKIKKLDLNLIVAHFNHGLRAAESRLDAEFVARLANDFGFAFVCKSQPAAFPLDESRDNLEQAARRARYEFLFQTALENRAEAVLTAHTLDDQAETFLLRLVRGSGADGLAAMNSISDYELPMTNCAEEADVLVEKSAICDFELSIKLIRPLLGWARRAMIEDYCRTIGIEFRRDAMNDDERFARVRVRKQLLPLLKTFNPQIVEILAHTANSLRADAAALDAQAALFLAKHDFKLFVADCAPLAAGLRLRVLRGWLRRERGGLRRITRKHLLALDGLLTKRAGGRTIELPAGAKVVCERGQIVYRAQVEKTTDRN